MSKSTPIFLSENDPPDKLLSTFSSQLDTEKLKNEISTIFSKIYNNYVGYYLFNDSGTYYKIFILPKHIQIPTNVSDYDRAIREFIIYLREYYRLRSIYPTYNQNELRLPSYKEISFEAHEWHSIQSIEQFTFYKYISILKRIEAFFAHHSSHYKTTKAYVSQSVKHRINLKSNIQELDKSKIHQDKIEAFTYSEMATIAYAALRLFINKKIELIILNEAQLISQVDTIQRMLLKRFNANTGISLSSGKLLSNRTYKHFSKKIEYRLLYVDLLSLFGLEHFYNEENSGDIYFSEKADAIFLRPESLFEWYTYDYILENLTKVASIFEIDPDSTTVKMKDTKSYSLKFDQNMQRKESIPDIIIESTKKVLIDVKWKRVGNLNEITDSDMLKLERDLKIHYATSAFLVYEKVADKINNKKISVQYIENEESFNFQIISFPLPLT